MFCCSSTRMAWCRSTLLRFVVVVLPKPQGCTATAALKSFLVSCPLAASVRALTTTVYPPPGLKCGVEDQPSVLTLCSSLLNGSTDARISNSHLCSAAPGGRQQWWLSNSVRLRDAVRQALRLSRLGSGAIHAAFDDPCGVIQQLSAVKV